MISNDDVLIPLTLHVDSFGKRTNFQKSFCYLLEWHYWPNLTKYILQLLFCSFIRNVSNWNKNNKFTMGLMDRLPKIKLHVLVVQGRCIFILFLLSTHQKLIVVIYPLNSDLPFCCSLLNINKRKQTNSSYRIQLSAKQPGWPSSPTFAEISLNKQKRKFHEIGYILWSSDALHLRNFLSSYWHFSRRYCLNLPFALMI